MQTENVSCHNQHGVIRFAARSQTLDLDDRYVNQVLESLSVTPFEVDESNMDASTWLTRDAAGSAGVLMLGFNLFCLRLGLLGVSASHPDVDHLARGSRDVVLQKSNGR